MIQLFQFDRMSTRQWRNGVCFLVASDTKQVDRVNKHIIDVIPFESIDWLIGVQLSTGPVQ